MNKKLIWVVLIVITFAGFSMAIDFMGPPTASLDEGQTKIGYTYHRSKNDLVLEEMRLGGVSIEGDMDFEDLEITRNYFTVNYGLESQRMEVYTFLGTSKLEIDDEDFSSGTDFAVGVGTKITTNINDDADWGILVQASWLHAEDTLVVGPNDVVDGHTLSGTVEAEVDMCELQVAAGPTIKMMDEWKVYAGVVGYWVFGDLDIEGSGTIDGSPASGALLSADIEEDSAFGGYIGTQIDLYKNLSIAGEYVYTGDCEGFGGNIFWRF